MSVLSRIKGLLLTRFPAASYEETFQPRPEISMPLRWPAYIVDHVGLNVVPFKKNAMPADTEDSVAIEKFYDTKQRDEIQTCANKWSLVIDIMRGTMRTMTKDPEHDDFLANLNTVCAYIFMAHEQPFRVSTKNLIEVYRSRHVFDEVHRKLESGSEKAAIISGFKDKYIEMMEDSVLPFIAPGWNKGTPQGQHPAPGIL